MTQNAQPDRDPLGNGEPTPRAGNRLPAQSAQKEPICGHIWTDRGSHKCVRPAGHTLIHRCLCNRIGDREDVTV